MRRFVLGCGLLRRGDSVLLVRCRYPGEPEPLWALPGGGQEAAESLAETVKREFLEETSLDIVPERIAYLSESVDPQAVSHTLSCTFWVREADPTAPPRPADRNVVAARFVPIREAPALLQADVLRIPVAAAFAETSQVRYYSFRHEDILVPFFGRAKRP